MDYPKLHAGHLGEFSYGEIIRTNVNRKWPTPELKEWWYAKKTVALRKKLGKLFVRQSGRCIYCNVETWLADPDGGKHPKPPQGMKHRQRATADHKKPQALGGTDRMANLVMACTYCNNQKQTTSFEEFLEARSDPDKWHERNKALNDLYQANAKERSVKSESRATALVWKLGVLFYLRPDLVEVAWALPRMDRSRNRK